MRIAILGGAGFIGQQLALDLLKRRSLVIDGGDSREISEIIIVDKVSGLSIPPDARLTYLDINICNAEQLLSLFNKQIDVIFHLAAVVSGEAEQNFDLGMDVNLYASINLLEIIRKTNHNLILVFASSCAVFGGDLDEIVKDATATTPLSSYGTQKAISELLINDYSRRGFVDGRVLRLPTIAIRPGKANAATSSFISSIVRDTIQGQRANCPVSMDAEFFILSPKGVIFDFVHAAGLDKSQLGSNRIISLPGLTVSIGEIVSALADIAGQEVADRIDWKPDKFLEDIVLTWPAHFETKRGEKLGFYKEESVRSIISGFIESNVT